MSGLAWSTATAIASVSLSSRPSSTAVRARDTQARVITSSCVRSPRTKWTAGLSGSGFSATSSQAHSATWNRFSAVSSAMIRSVRPGQ
jgi:hypothetical protein